ncbi:hydrolase [Actinorhabdospora filicis]|uniref:Hydrolase n=1 Tax=Actinorhabdospora filicis TaxID=1785913 RepID=A0A9W6SHL0_9ACTN|nr:alpha/beta hydrolase [Actinorhabdospora filicis]GLZ75992.1 hydrolase [Actinorhabdospora filicis]
MEYSLDVPGATIHYRLRGDGPPLLVLGGGYANADTLAPLVDELAAHYTVLTHDRRGQARSPRSGGTASITEHAEDVARLLSELGEVPVAVYGSSIGALIALELTARHPELVHTLVALEPPDTGLLDGALRERADADLLGADRAFRESGAMAGLARFGAFAGVDPRDREDGVVLEDPRERMADLEYFLGEECAAIAAHHVDVEALKAAPTRIVPVSGVNSADLWVRVCAVELAARLGVPWQGVPGAHNGDMFRPHAFAARLRELLAG